MSDGYTFVNNTSRTETHSVYCMVLDCGELLAVVSVLPHSTVVITDASCKVPRIMERHNIRSGESGDG